MTGKHRSQQSQWCAPGAVLCPVCFNCVPVDRLVPHPDGGHWDVCLDCKDKACV